jgi:hypothetical protein
MMVAGAGESISVGSKINASIAAVGGSAVGVRIILAFILGTRLRVGEEIAVMAKAGVRRVGKGVLNKWPSASATCTVSCFSARGNRSSLALGITTGVVKPEANGSTPKVFNGKVFNGKVFNGEVTRKDADDSSVLTPTDAVSCKIASKPLRLPITTVITIIRARLTDGV